MSKYTTGEIAKLCGVSVRTVQYYDSRNILIPSELSEGGRRLYSEDDLKRMRIICFLREAGVPISSIGQLFEEEHPEKAISILLDQQEKALKSEIAEGQKKLEIIETIKRSLKEIDSFTVESIGDIAHIMKQKDKLAKMRWMLVFVGLPITIFGAVSSPAFNLVDLVVVLLAALLLFLFGRTDKELSRREGVIMVITVVVYYLYLFIA